MIFNRKTEIFPPLKTDVMVITTNGSGKRLRSTYLNRKKKKYSLDKKSELSGTCSIYQNSSNRAFDKSMALGFGMGLSSMYETDLNKQVYNTMLNTKGIMLALIKSSIVANYNILRKYNHCPLEAYDKTMSSFGDITGSNMSSIMLDDIVKENQVFDQLNVIEWVEKLQSANEPILDSIYRDMIDNMNQENPINSFNTDIMEKDNLLKNEVKKRWDITNTKDVNKIEKILKLF